MKKAYPKIYYGYVVVAAAVCIMTLAWGANRSFGVFLESMLREFGWTKAGLSGAFTLVMVLMGGTSILVGRLTDLFGPRIVGVICGLFLELGYILISQVTEIWHLYLFFGGLTGIGMSIAFAPLMSIVARWFVKRRALMTGILVSGPALGITLMPLLFSALIPVYGWRNSNIILGSIVLLMVVPAALFLRRDPKQMGLLPYGAVPGKPQTLGIQTEGLSLREAIATRQFWMVCVMSFCDLFLINVLVVHLVIYAIELTIPPIQAAGILSVAAGVSIPGRILIGWVADRIGNKPALLICLILSVAAFTLLLAARNLWTLYLFASLYGFSLWVTGALTSPLLADMFGLKSHATIFSFTALFSAVGSGVGPVVVGHIFDITGSYKLAFLLCLFISVIALTSVIFIKPLHR